jgi:hypothetical protein
MEQNLGVIIAIIGSSVATVGTVLAMMFWCRSEANSLRAEAKQDRKDMLQISRNLELAVAGMQTEMKDFHNRLCAIEERKQK